MHNTYFQKNTLLWLFLFSVIFIFEFFLFKTFVLREIVDFYPRAFDQTSYLMRGYSAYENTLAHGLGAGLKNSTVPNSVLFLPQTLFFFLVFGASRFSALAINLFYFFGLQAAIIYVSKWLTGRYSIGLIAVGLLLCLLTPFSYVGGLNDFRIDFMALCWYGIFLSATIRSQLFLDRRWTIIAAVCACFLILLRCLTSLYVGSLVAFMMTYLFIRIRSKKSTQTDSQDNKTRFRNLILFSIILGLAILPFLWANREMIYGYYVTAGMLNEPKIRSLEFGTTNLLSTLSFYPRSLSQDHFGTLALLGMGFLVFLTFIARFIPTPLRSSEHSLHDKTLFSFINVFLVAAFAIPFVILTLYPTKSPSVGSIMLTPVIWLVIVNFANRVSLKRNILLLLAIVFLAVGMKHWVQKFGQHGYGHLSKASELTKMYDDIGQYVENVEWKRPTFSADQLIEYVTSLTLNDLYYERHGVMLNAGSTLLGSTLFSVEPAVAENTVKASDIFITNSGNYPATVYPFNQSMQDMQPALQKIAARNFIYLGEYSFNQARLQVYVKPDVIISGLSGDWITSEGIMVSIPAQVAKYHPTQVILTGDITSASISPRLSVTALGENNAGIKIPLPAKLTIKDNQYVIAFSLPADKDVTKVHLKFSTFFVPKDKGMNSDTRELVLPAPTKRTVLLTHLS